MLSLTALLALPGVVIHELGHYLLCQLCGARVDEVVFFEPSGPSGYVVHAVPRRLAQHALIVLGPLLLNSALAFLLFRAALASGSLALAHPSPWPLLQSLVAGLLGGSIALQALPSHADASSLQRVSLDRLQAGHLLALLAVPLALLLLLANVLRRFWFDWLYAGGLAALAWWFPAR
jgi:hypothetical protein